MLLFILLPAHSGILKPSTHKKLCRTPAQVRSSYKKRRTRYPSDMSHSAATDPHTQWGFCPSLPVSILFLALFALTTSIHIFQAAYHRNPYSWVIIMSGLWQTLCYVFRTLSIQNPTSSPYFAAWFVLILIAPLWTNAFVYMVVGRAVWNFKAGRKILGLKASGLGLVFVVLDVVAFVVQAYGAATATGTDTPQEVALRGRTIWNMLAGD